MSDNFIEIFGEDCHLNFFQEEGKMAEGYCVKCKAKKQMVNSSEITMANGRQAIKGKCPDCGTGMFKILGKKK